jgi:hypothetical protein
MVRSGVTRINKPSKLKRELARLGRQLGDLPERVLGPIARARYNATRAKTVIPTDGGRSLGPKLAVFLLFQRGDLPGSIKVTCDWLTDNGYSVLCVANGGLTDPAKTDLLPNVWRLLERPNFGYDFGGYREGILHLAEAKITPESLLILNDSIWLPTRPQSDLITRLEAMDAPVAGLIINRRERATTRYAKAGFIESYMYRISGEFARSDIFASYWANLKISNDKMITIKRGEKGFSRFLVDKKIDFKTLLNNADFKAELSCLKGEDLLQAMTYACYDTTEGAAERDALLRNYGARNWEADVHKHITQQLETRPPHSSFLYYREVRSRIDFLKKRADLMCKSGRASYLSAVRAGHLPAPAPEILCEIEAMVAKETA